MRIIYSKEFLRKSNIPNYPLTGYYYQLGKKTITNESQSWEDLYEGNHSIFYPCNTMIRKFDGELKCKISFLIDPEDAKEEKNYKVIFIIAIDNTIYRDLDELKKFNDKKKDDFSQVAAIMIIDGESGFSNNDINILDMQYVPKCSFSLVENDNDQVTHYQSEDYDKSNLYLANNSQFIEFNSGSNKLRDLMATQNPVALKGHMTIRGSGVIQL